MPASVPPSQAEIVLEAPDVVADRMPIAGRLGPYLLLAVLGRGGWGSVFKARDSRSGACVALKLLQFGHGTPEADVLARFRREALADFGHPGLCRVHDAGSCEGRHYVVMDLIEGEPLSSLLRHEAPLAEGQAVGLVRDLALALQAAHDQGVVHRDLKPSNVVVRPDGRPVVIDFGLALWEGTGATRFTRTGTVLGTPHYMAPEQVRGEVRAMGPGCDIFSLGVVLYEMLTGRLPFEGTLASVLGKILFFEPDLPSAHRPEVSPRLEAVCLKAMAKEVADRYASMADLAGALEDV